jgi:hypothetical protein
MTGDGGGNEAQSLANFQKLKSSVHIHVVRNLDQENENRSSLNAVGIGQNTRSALRPE